MNKSIEQFQGDCSSLTLQQLILVKSKLSSEISIIQTQLDMPHDYRHETPEWKLRARAAIRHKQVELSYVTDLVTHYECTKYLDFYNQARHLLDPDTFTILSQHQRSN